MPASLPLANCRTTPLVAIALWFGHTDRSAWRYQSCIVCTTKYPVFKPCRQSLEPVFNRGRQLVALSQLYFRRTTDSTCPLAVLVLDAKQPDRTQPTLHCFGLTRCFTDRGRQSIVLPPVFLTRCQTLFPVLFYSFGAFCFSVIVVCHFLSCLIKFHRRSTFCQSAVTLTWLICSCVFFVVQLWSILSQL